MDLSDVSVDSRVFTYPVRTFAYVIQCEFVKDPYETGVFTFAYIGSIDTYKVSLCFDFCLLRILFLLCAKNKIKAT